MIKIFWNRQGNGSDIQPSMRMWGLMIGFNFIGFMRCSDVTRRNEGMPKTGFLNINSDAE